MQKNPKSSFSTTIFRWGLVAVLLFFLAFLVPSPAMMESLEFSAGKMNSKLKAFEKTDMGIQKTESLLTLEGPMR